MRVQATNSNGLGNRLRCFLAALRMNESATIYWNPKLQDGVTEPKHIGSGDIEPFEELFDSDRSAELDLDAWQVPKYAYFVKACESGERSVYSLIENVDPRIKEAYLELKKKYLRPTEAVKNLAIPRFHIGFQIRTKEELIKTPDSKIDPSIYQFIKDAHYPVFVASDSEALSNELMNANPYVFCFNNPAKYVFDAEWKWSMAEILTMAGCRTLYVTPGSTYGEMGYLMGDYEPIVRSCHDPIAEVDQDTLRRPKVIV